MNEEQLAEIKKTHRLVPDGKGGNYWKRRYEVKVKRKESTYGLCGICRKDKKLVCDHDHTNGMRRGKICGTCNSMLGMAYDSVKTLIVGARYLKYWQREHKFIKEVTGGRR